MKGPSVFPILFACVLGRASHSIQVWRLERGERISTLDVLAGSTSLTSTVISQFKLRILSAFGLALIAVWTLSPYGGQACLRQMGSSSTPSVQDTSAIYLAPPGSLSHLSAPSVELQYRTIDFVFAAALFASAAIKASLVDTWGHVKIPRVEELELADTPHKEGWFKTSGQPVNYSSLLGIPLAWNSTFTSAEYSTTIETQYLHLNCSLVRGNHTSQPDYFASPNLLDIRYRPVNFAERSRLTLAALYPFNFTYFHDDLLERPISHCLLTTTYVEAEVSCATAASSTCGVTRVRRSLRSNPPPAYTSMDTRLSNSEYVVDLFMEKFRSLSGTGLLQASSNGRGPIQNYLVDPDKPLVMAGSSNSDMAYLPSNVTFSVRLAQLFNTYWIAMQAPEEITAVSQVE